MMLKILAAVSYMILTAAGERPPISAIERTLFASPQPEARPEYAERGSLSEAGPEFDAKEEEKEVLDEENATKQLRSSVAEMSEEAEGSEGVGTSLKLLMSSAAEFFDSAEMAEEVAALEGLALVKELAAHGVSLRDRFQAFVLQQSLKMALGHRAPPQPQVLPGDEDPEDTDDDDEEVNDHDEAFIADDDLKDFFHDNDLTEFYDDDDSPLDKAFILEDDEELTITTGDDNEEMVKYERRMDGSIVLKDLDDEKEDGVGMILFKDIKDDKAKEEDICTQKDVAGEAKAIEPWTEDDAFKKADVADSLRAYCQIARIDKEGKGDELPPNEAKRKKLAADLQPLRSLAAKDMTDAVREKPGKQSNYLDALFKAMARLILMPSPSKFPATTSLAGMRRIYSRALAQELRIRDAVAFVQKKLKQNWLHVRAHEHIVKRMAMKAAKVIMNIVKNAARVVALPFKALWVFFRSKLRKGDEKCQKANEQEDVQRAYKAELEGKNALQEEQESSKLVNRMLNANAKDEEEERIQKQKKAPTLIQTLTTKSEKALDMAEKDGQLIKEKSDEIKKELAGYADITKAIQEEEEEEKRKNKERGEQSQVETLRTTITNLEEQDKNVEKAEEKLCKKVHGESASSFKKAFKKAREETKWPNLGTRGVVAQLGPAAGGIEEILDFHNLEIAQFKFGAALIGASMIGAGVGSYAGIGWKGYKRDWSLESAIGEGLFLSYGISFCGTPFSAGVTLAIDANEVFQPDIGGAKAVAFGYSVSSSATILPVTVDAGASKYDLLHAECFDSIGEFIKYLWWPGCKWCETKQERRMVGAMRAGVKIVSFPIIAETVHTVLALLYYRSLKPEVKKRPGSERCGSMSTRDPEKLSKKELENLKKVVMLRVMNTLYQSMLQLKVMTGQVQDLQLALLAAQRANKHLYFSDEYWALEKEVGTEMQACLPGPLEDAGSLYSKPKYPDDPREVKELCKALGLLWCDDEKEMLMRMRVGGAVSLSKGRLKYAQELSDAISRCSTTFKGHGELKDFFKAAKAKCEVGKEARKQGRADEGDTCLTGLQAAQELKATLLGKVDWAKVCTCMKLGKKICASGTPPEHLIHRILLAAGAGEVGLATTTNAFGMCSWNGCPWKETQVCERTAGYLPLKRCRCKKGYCFFPGEGQCANSALVKEKGKNPITVDSVITKMRHYIWREQAAVGGLARDLRVAAYPVVA